MRVPVRLRTVDSERNYQAMGLLDIVALFVHEYEESNIEIPKPGMHRAPRVMRPTHRAIASPASKTPRAGSAARSEKSFVHRGIKLPRITGKRSPTALALREALLTKYRK